MHKSFHDDFERGQVDEYKVRAMDVGDLYIIHLQNSRGGLLSNNFDWFVNKVTILKEGSDAPYEFPCYSWILKDLVVFNGAGN
jgi:arachidonate 5-lipoxygenase